MTIAERKRARSFIRVSDICGGLVTTKLTLPLFTAFAVIVLAIASWSTYVEGSAYDILPITSAMSFLVFMPSLLSGMSEGDTVVKKDMPEVFHGSAARAKFFCTLPFESGDMLNARIIHWEKSAVVSAVLYAAAQVISMIMEAAGSPMYHSYCGTSFIFAVVTAVLLLCGSFTGGFAAIILGGIYGGSIAFFTDLLSAFEEDIPAIARLDETMPALGAFYGVSGILLYIAALAVIDIIAQFAVKKRRDVSWHLK